MNKETTFENNLEASSTCFNSDVLKQEVKTYVNLEELNSLTGNSVSNHTNYNFSRWIPIGGKCPNCGSTDTEYDSSMVLACFPAKYRCRCKKCEHTWYSTMQTEISPMPSYPGIGGGKTGWICPVCGRGVNPDISVCPYCKPYSNTITCTSATSNLQG